MRAPDGIIDQSGVAIRMSDGVDVSVRVYRPDGDGPHPTLFAASPYRYDNDDVAHSPMWLWHETGPIHWYVARGYAYAHLDVRGSGRSGGDYEFFGPRERRDYYEVIEWIAAQPWSTGRVGGIGQSYYGAAQWCMAAERPPSLACIAPFDGHMDFYRGWFFAGGIQSNFIQEWWNNAVRLINRQPFNGVEPRLLTYDLLDDLSRHPVIDEYWEARRLDEALAAVDIPVYSVGLWFKRDLHLGGNVRGFQLVRGPKKLLFSDVRSVPEAVMQFSSVAFHEAWLAPFYDRFLKDADTEWEGRPAVHFPITGGEEVGAAESWPPPGVSEAVLHLRPGPTGSVASINDGALGAPVERAEPTSYAYPDPRWTFGNAVMTPHGPDTVLRSLTFTSEPLAEDVVVAGAPVLTLWLSSTATDTQVIVKLSCQQPRVDEARQPPYQIVAKGWLRASQRALAPELQVGDEPYHRHTSRESLEPGRPYELVIPLTHMAHRFAAGTRIRLELCCADSPVTETVFSHVFGPDMAGTDSIHHDADHPSRLALPMLRGRVG